MADVLARCFEPDPSRRWSSLAEAADARSVACIATRSGPTTLGPVPVAPNRNAQISVTHDRRTTNSVQWTDPREWLTRAMQAEGRDPSEIDRFLPPRTGSRKAQAIADLAIYEEARRIYERLVAQGRDDLKAELAALCGNMAFVNENLDDIPGAMTHDDRAIALLEHLVEREGRREQANNLAAACMNKANALCALGDLAGAVALYDRVIALLEHLVEREGRRAGQRPGRGLHGQGQRALMPWATSPAPWRCTTGPSPSSSTWSSARGGASWPTTWPRPAWARPTALQALGDLAAPWRCTTGPSPSVSTWS